MKQKHITKEISRKIQSKFDFINKLKNKPCELCGLSFSAYYMDFNHLGGKSINKMVYSNCTVEDISSEINKSWLLCANCNKIQTYLNGNNVHHKLVSQQKQWVRDIKCSNSCMDCGLKYHFAAMEFHHRDPETKFMAIGKMYNFSLDEIKEEVAKCDLLCTICHRKRHLTI